MKDLTIHTTTASVETDRWYQLTDEQRAEYWRLYGNREHQPTHEVCMCDVVGAVRLQQRRPPLEDSGRDGDNTTSGKQGVEKRGNSFRARIREHGKIRTIGSFKTLQEAMDAYKAEADKHYGGFYNGHGS